MQNNNLSKEKTEDRGYHTPACEVSFVDQDTILCDSGTERVGEDNGEW